MKKKDIETITKGKSEVKNAVSELNNTVEGINSRLDEPENWISDLEDKVEKNHPGRAAKRKKNFKKWGELKKHFGQHEA